jgi:hypothetical protein
VEEKNSHGIKASVSLRQFGQYQGAGAFTGFGLLLRHLAQRKRLPFTAVFGRTFFPVLGKFFAIATSSLLVPDLPQEVLTPEDNVIRVWDWLSLRGSHAVFSRSLP